MYIYTFLYSLVIVALDTLRYLATSALLHFLFSNVSIATRSAYVKCLYVIVCPPLTIKKVLSDMPTALSYIYFNSKINLILLVIFTIYTGNVNCPVNTSSESFISVKPYALEIVSLSAQTGNKIILSTYSLASSIVRSCFEYLFATGFS